MTDPLAHLPKTPFGVRPALLGSVLPATPVTGADGADTPLAGAIAGEPAVVVFYRGGW